MDANKLKLLFQAVSERFVSVFYFRMRDGI